MEEDTYDTEKAAFLDLDGTLVNGNLSIQIVPYLAKEGLFDKRVAERIADIAEKVGKGEITYEDFLGTYGALWAEGNKGRDAIIMQSYLASLFDMLLKSDVYDLSYSLVDALKSRGYTPILVSVGAIEINALAALGLGIERENTYSTELEIVDGVYTGRILTDLHLPTGKAQVLKKLSERFSLEDSFAFGDAISDVEMLEMVGRPVALNPSRALRKVAEERGWKISEKSKKETLVEERGLNLKNVDPNLIPARVNDLLGPDKAQKKKVT